MFMFIALELVLLTLVLPALPAEAAVSVLFALAHPAASRAVPASAATRLASRVYRC
jgi:hypothetical protein